MSGREAEQRRFLTAFAYYAAIALLFALTVRYLLPLSLPFLFGAAAAGAVRKPAAAMAGKVPEKACRLVLLTVLLLIVCAVVLLIGGGLVRQLGELAARLPSILGELSSKVVAAIDGIARKTPGRLGEAARGAMEEAERDISGSFASLSGWLAAPAAELAGQLGSAAMRLPGLAAGGAAAVICAYFLAADPDGIKKELLSAIPAKAREKLSAVRLCAVDTAAKLVRAYALIMLLTFSELAVGFAAINLTGERIEYFLPLALLISLVDILPVLGVGTVLLPWSAADMLSGRFLRGGLLLALYAVIVVVRNVLEPRLIGRRLGLSPIAALAAIYAGGKLLGFPGVFILPLTLIIFRRLRDQNSTAQPGSM